MDAQVGDVLPKEWMARREYWNRGVSLFARQVHVGKGVMVAKELEFETVEEDGLHMEPFTVLRIQEAQQLMDELWQCGLRPTEGSGSAGSLAATERHLKDMRLIVFDQMDITEGKSV